LRHFLQVTVVCMLLPSCGHAVSTDWVLAFAAPQFVAYGREEGGFLVKHPLHEAWLEQAGLMPEEAQPAG